MNSLSGLLSILALGLAAGVLSGLFGIGGGLVIVPGLVILFGLDQKTATGTSLLALLMPVGLLAVIDYYRRDKLQVSYGLWIAPGLFVGALIGSRLTVGLSDQALKRVYAGFLVIVAAYYVMVSTDRGKAWIFKPRAIVAPQSDDAKSP